MCVHSFGALRYSPVDVYGAFGTQVRGTRAIRRHKGNIKWQYKGVAFAAEDVDGLTHTLARKQGALRALLCAHFSFFFSRLVCRALCDGGGFCWLFFLAHAFLRAASYVGTFNCCFDDARWAARWSLTGIIYCWMRTFSAQCSICKVDFITRATGLNCLLRTICVFRVCTNHLYYESLSQFIIQTIYLWKSVNSAVYFIRRG